MGYPRWKLAKGAIRTSRHGFRFTREYEQRIEWTVGPPTGLSQIDVFSGQVIVS